ncbi:hypothetical protein CAC42_2969 [Sphaceloma murrayae]|uniref:E3 ubiquitin-protein ligase listerin n=1 Tax=Sphaceloma murrayae TaxID=2082308 RepID=A0A2K1R096_9PEZI|nr:hypothetical protein CAC42_2969 [Sphaceloma murrayae]
MKKTFKSQASSGRAAFGAPARGGFGTSTFESHSSLLSYVYEPPNLSGISDPNVAVQLKNLMKKDGTTKSKALEDIISNVASAKGEIEQDLFAAYVKLYPRLSIDPDRRVRQLSHTLIGHIVTKCGKRMVPYLPSIAGSWLSGQYDPDRAAARAALEAYQQAFNTQDKAQNFRKVFHRQVAEYCRDATLFESPQTLSDMRNVSKEDADAIYNRVVATSLTLVSVLITHVSENELDKVSDVYTSIITDKVFLELLSAPDPPTRASVVKVIRSCLNQATLASHLDYPLTASVLFNKVLSVDQLGTAGDVLDLLLALSEQQPNIWTDTRSKKSPDHRLKSFIKKGPQNSTSDFWDTLGRLFDRIPPEVLPSDATATNEWMTALLDGVSRRQEAKHVASAWIRYPEIAERLSRQLSEPDRVAFFNEWIVPAISQYLKSETINNKWSISAPKPEVYVAKLFLMDGMSGIALERWPEYTDGLIETMKTSLPEQSNDYKKSQEAVAEAIRRWIALQLAIRSGQFAVPTEMDKALADQAISAARAAIDLLLVRHGKPYGSATMISELLRHQDRILPSSDVALIKFLEEDAVTLLASPSRPALINALLGVANFDGFDSIWTSWASALSKEAMLSGTSEIAIDFFMDSKGERVSKLAQANEDVQNFLRAQLQPPKVAVLAPGQIKVLSMFTSDTTVETILIDSVRALSIGGEAASVIENIEQLDQVRPEVLRSFAASDSGNDLLASIILVQQSASGEVAEKAAILHDRLLGIDGRPMSPNSSMNLIKREIQSASPNSLPIGMVLDIARSQLAESTTDMLKLLVSLTTVWEASLNSCVLQRPAASFAIMNPLGGLVHLVEGQQGHTQPSLDNEGLSLSIRIAMFVLVVLSQTQAEGQIEARQEAQLLSLLSWTALLADDNSNIYGDNGTWRRSTFGSIEDLVVGFVADSRKLINGRLDKAGTDSDLFAEYADLNQESVNSLSYLDFCKARTYLSASNEAHEGHGFPKQKISEMEEDLKQYRKETKVFAMATAVSILSSQLSGSPYLQRYLNELIADISASEAAKPDHVLFSVSFLNLILQGGTGIASLVQKHKLVMLVKHLIPWLVDGVLPAYVRGEVATSIRLLLPSMQDVYGEHWTDLLHAIAKIFKDGMVAHRSTNGDEGRLVLVHAALRLHTVLDLAAKDKEPNEDLLDAMKDGKSLIEEGLVSLLVEQRTVPETDHVPMKIVDELIARKASQICSISSAIAEDLYPQLDSTSGAVRSAAFGLLKSHVVGSQEQISLDAALEKKTAHLPEQLLSLILDAPDNDAVLSASFEEKVPQDLQTYLLSWLLVFAHFEKSSAKVRIDYVDDLKSSDHLPPLLDLVYDFLGHTANHPIDASKFPISMYTPGTQDTPEQETQSLLIHLYYLSLVNLPSLVKQHYLTLSNRVLSSAISTWAAKYMSPLVIATLFQRVTEWTSELGSDSDHDNFSVKTSPRSREITATYLIDEQPMSILIALPESYPLTGATVTGLSRAALDPKKWQAWLRNCQGVIQFSNGDLVDGLVSWRRNVSEHDRNAHFYALYKECGWPDNFNPVKFARLREQGGWKYGVGCHWADHMFEILAPRNGAHLALRDLLKRMWGTRQGLVARISEADREWKRRYEPGHVDETAEKDKRAARLLARDFWAKGQEEVKNRRGRYAGYAWAGVSDEEWDTFRQKRLSEADGKLEEIAVFLEEEDIDRLEASKWEQAKMAARHVSEEAWVWLAEDRREVYEKDAKSFLYERFKTKKCYLLGESCSDCEGFLLADAKRVLVEGIALDVFERELVKHCETHGVPACKEGMRWKNEDGRVTMADPPVKATAAAASQDQTGPAASES